MSHAEAVEADVAFVAALEDASLPTAEFTHRNHLRAAWLYLRAHPLSEAARRCGSAIRSYAAAHGVAEKYHHTLTLAFMHLVHERMQRSSAASWQGFLAEFPEIERDARALIARHYSDELLRRPEARREFIPPDRAPLP